MSRREQTLRWPFPVLAAAVAVVTGGTLLWDWYGRSSAKEEKKDGGGPAPNETQTCPPGYALKDGKCVSADGAPQVPSLLPDPNTMKGPMLPPRGKILIVGGELAVGLARALATTLTRVEQTKGYEITPSSISVWDGAPVLYSFEMLSAGLSANGVPRAPACAACPPDLVIVFAGEVNMHWGPVDEGTAKAIAHLTDTWSVYARDHFPNVLWVSPPTNPDFDAPPFESQLTAMMFLSAQTARPGRSAFLNLKRFERAYPNAPVPGLGAEPRMVDHVRPNDAGYAAIAQQVADLLSDWYARHPGVSA